MSDSTALKVLAIGTGVSLLAYYVNWSLKNKIPNQANNDIKLPAPEAPVIMKTSIPTRYANASVFADRFEGYEEPKTRRVVPMSEQEETRVWLAEQGIAYLTYSPIHKEWVFLDPSANSGITVPVARMDMLLYSMRFDKASGHLFDRATGIQIDERDPVQRERVRLLLRP